MQEHSLSQRAVAETLGTALLVLVGPGSVVATLALAGDSVPAVTGADLLGISFAFGFIIAAMVYAIGKVSGCHINPAVTFALASTKKFPWREVPAYWAAQVVGAVLGGARHLGAVRLQRDRPRDGPDVVQPGRDDVGVGDLRRGHRDVHADVRDPRDRRLALARRLRRPDHRRRRRRDHHGRRPGHRRLAEPRARVRAGARLGARQAARRTGTSSSRSSSCPGWWAPRWRRSPTTS